jgi:DNA polymerase III alpha subunit (gram-positive type)
VLDLLVVSEVAHRKCHVTSKMFLYYFSVKDSLFGESIMEEILDPKKKGKKETKKKKEKKKGRRQNKQRNKQNVIEMLEKCHLLKRWYVTVVS